LPPGTKFCQACGAAIGGPGPSGISASSGMSASVKPWIVAGGAVVIVVLTVVVWGSAARPPAQQAAAIAPAPVDFSGFTPQAKADTLFNAVMWAHSRGDQGGVMNFATMAVEAYAALGVMTADSRYHLGTIYSVAGPMDMALVQADSLELAFPGHLFTAMLRGGVARVRRDTAALDEAYRTFLENYDAEIAAGRSEYRDHATTVDAFLAEAREATGAGG